MPSWLPLAAPVTCAAVHEAAGCDGKGGADGSVLVVALGKGQQLHRQRLFVGEGCRLDFFSTTSKVAARMDFISSAEDDVGGDGGAGELAVAPTVTVSAAVAMDVCSNVAKARLKAKPALAEVDPSMCPPDSCSGPDCGSGVPA